MFWGVGSGFPVYKAVELRLAQWAGFHTVEGAEHSGCSREHGQGCFRRKELEPLQE